MSIRDSQPRRSRRQPDSRLSLGNKRILFAKSIHAGDTIEQASQKANISPRTGYRWHKQLRGMSDIASKDELARHLTNALADSPVQYKAALAEKLAKVMGYESPRQVELTDKTPRASIRELLAEWMLEHAQHESHDAAKALAANVSAPTIEARADASVLPDGGRSPQDGGIGGALTNSHTATNSDKRLEAQQATKASEEANQRKGLVGGISVEESDDSHRGNELPLKPEGPR